MASLTNTIIFFCIATVSAQFCADISYEKCGKKSGFPVEVLRDVGNVSVCQIACQLKPSCQFMVFDNFRKDCHLHEESLADFTESCTFFAAPVDIDLDFCRYEDTCSVV